MIEDFIFSENCARLDGFLQKMDAKVKLSVALIAIILVSLSKNFFFIAFIYVLTIFLARASKIEIKFFMLRVWLFIPIFSGIIALPSLFLNMQEMYEFSVFIARVAASVSIAVLLTLTTKWNELLGALRIFGMPKIFVMILSITYRYIFLLLKIVREMRLAKKSRTIKIEPSGERKIVASNITVLLRKSYKMSEEVYFAMVSRGFR